MAAATRLLAKSGACVAVLNYDDALLVATGITNANIGGTEPITFFITVLGVTFSRTVDIGQTAIITFPSAGITIGTSPNGQPNFVIAGVSSYGIGSA